MLSSAAAALAAEPFGCGGPETAGCQGGERYHCGDPPPQLYFREPLDLDGDGAAEFERIAFKAASFCFWTEWNGEPASRVNKDTTEALFPVQGVEVYILPLPEYIKGVRIPLWPQEPIEPAPALVGSRWEWHTVETSPYLRAFGLGWTGRVTETFPCRDPKHVCREESWPGLLANEPRDGLVEAIVGFRVRRADGWHLGWVWLRRGGPPTPEEYQYPFGNYFISVVDWAVHPEPDTALRAGERPRPGLTAGRDAAADQVVVAWHPNWTGWVLERARAPAGAPWEPAPGVTNNMLRLPTGDGPWFFRLRAP